MGQWSYGLKEYARHVEHQCEKHMEYDGMNGGVVNLGGRHQWHQRMWPMSKYNKGGNLVMLEASQPL